MAMQGIRDRPIYEEDGIKTKQNIRATLLFIKKYDGESFVVPS